MRLPERIEYELGWMALSALFGVSYLTAVPTAAVRDLLPGWFVPVWAVALLASGVAGVAGCVLGCSVRPRRAALGQAVELAAVGGQIGAVFTLGLATAYLWQRTPGAPVPAVGLSLASVWLLINIRRMARLLSKIKE